MRFLPLQPGDVQDTHADIESLKQKFHYKPSTTVNEGVKNFIRWYKDYYKI